MIKGSIEYDDLKPIETTYAEQRFRSRLEARWAVFFDSAGIDWIYEPERFTVGENSYLPDFFLPRVIVPEVEHDKTPHVGVFCEVKPHFPNEPYMQLLRDFEERIDAATNRRKRRLLLLAAQKVTNAFEYSTAFPDLILESFRRCIQCGGFFVSTGDRCANFPCNSKNFDLLEYAVKKANSVRFEHSLPIRYSTGGWQQL